MQDDLTIEEKIELIAKKLLSSQTKVAFSGAGISAESGIPTFRDSAGLWEGYDPAVVATPEGFARNPSLVLRFYNERRRDAAAALPNPAHYALAELERLISPFYIITQNIDNLHQRAGAKNVIELHGNLFTDRCTNCTYKRKLDPEKIKDILCSVNNRQKRTNKDIDNSTDHTKDDIKGHTKNKNIEYTEHIEHKNKSTEQNTEKNIEHKREKTAEKTNGIEELFRCPRCNALLRPDIVWFGELLPQQALEEARRLAISSDIFFSIGTSAVVWPAAGLIYDAKSAGSFIVEINPNWTEASSIADIRIAEKAGYILPKIVSRLKQLLGIPDE